MNMLCNIMCALSLSSVSYVLLLSCRHYNIDPLCGQTHVFWILSCVGLDVFYLLMWPLIGMLGKNIVFV